MSWDRLDPDKPLRSQRATTSATFAASVSGVASRDIFRARWRPRSLSPVGTVALASREAWAQPRRRCEAPFGWTDRCGVLIKPHYSSAGKGLRIIHEIDPDHAKC